MKELFAGRKYCVSRRLSASFFALALLMAPGVAQSEGQLPRLTTGDFSSAEECGTCHKIIYDQWKTSGHSKSLSSPLYRSVVSEVLKIDNGKFRFFCLSCHTPVGSVGGETFRLTQPVVWDDLTGVAAEGVTCDFCHTISGDEARGKQITTGAYVFPRRGTTAVKYGVHADARTEAHDVTVSTFLPSAEFCSTCHRFRHPIDSVEIQNTFTEWQASAYPAQGVRCQDCHMPQFEGSTVEGSIHRSDLHAHYFDKDRLVSQAANLDITARPGPNSTLEVETKITNSGAGHSIPTGVPGLRNILLTVEVLSASYGSLGKQETSFRQMLLDGSGNEQLPWQDVKIIRDERIPSGESVTRNMTFSLPSSVQGGQVRIRANLTLQALSPYWSQQLGVEIPPAVQMAERTHTLVIP